MPRLLLAGLVLQAAAIVGVAGLVLIDSWLALGSAGLAVYLAVPAIGCALAAWGVRTWTAAPARAASIVFGAGAVLLAAAPAALRGNAESDGALIVFAMLFILLGWVLVPWIPSHRRAAALLLTVGSVALVLGMSFLGLVAAVDVALTRPDELAVALTVEVAVAGATLAIAQIAALRRHLATPARVPDGARRLLRLARIADLCAIGVATAAPIVDIVDHRGQPAVGAAGALFFLAVSILARRAIGRHDPALPVAVSRRAAR